MCSNNTKGAGVLADRALMDILNPIIASHTLGQPGGGILAAGSGAFVVVKNNIVFGNTLDNCDTALISELASSIRSATKPRHYGEDSTRSLAYNFAIPARARFSSERAYFMTCERSECPISSASSLTCPGFAWRNHVPNVRLRS